MKIKLNKGQQKKFNLISLYLMTKIGESDGIILEDNESTNIRWVTKIFINEPGIYIRGFNYCGTVRFTDRLNSVDDIIRVFQAGIRADYDFKNFVDMEELKD